MHRFLVSALLLTFTSFLLADELRGKVVSIADGDTITVLDADKKQHKVRLIGIDAPEKKQAFGAKSKARLGELVASKDVVSLLGDHRLEHGGEVGHRRLPQHRRAQNEGGHGLLALGLGGSQRRVHEHVPNELSVLRCAVAERPDLGKVCLESVRQRHERL